MSNFSFIKIDVPAAAGTYVYISADGVDAAGEAVGNYGNVDGEGDEAFDGFVTEGSSGITYNPPGSTNTDVVGITSTGEIFGNYVDNVLHQHGFVDNAGVVTKVDVLQANSTTVDGVNAAGVIYGEFADSSNHVHGFVDTNGAYTRIDVPGSFSTSVVGVNASGQIAGTYTDAGFAGHGFVESGGGFTTIDPAGSIDTSIVGIDDAGIVVGNYQDSANNLHAFIDTSGVITAINIAGATSTSVQAVNAAGEIVGYYTDGSGNIHGFVDHGGVVATVDVPGATETDILGVSATGVITGYFNDANGQHGFVGTLAPVVIESFGSTSLTQVGENYYLYANGTSTGPELRDGGSPVTAGQISGWTPIGAEQIPGGGYDVAWKNAATNQYTVWNTDSSGNVVSNAVGGIVSGTSSALELIETSFHQDLNGDGTIGPITTVIESFGSTSLTQVGSNFYFDNNSSGTGPEFQSGAAVVTAGEFGAWTFIGAEQTAGGYEVALHLPGADQYTVWNTDSSGNVVSNAVGGIVSGTSSALELIETSFHQDLNGDGTIGPIPTVIESSGSTSLVQVNSNFYFDNNSSGTGPEFQSGGAVVTAGEFGAWTFIGAEQTAGGYEVALHLPGTDQYTVWNTDSSGNVVSNAVGGIVSGTSSALELIETSFHQDLNGDGTIGPITTVIESFGSTSLTQVGSNFYFDNNSSGTGPEFQSGAAVVTAGEFGAWTFIGAEQTAGGYEVALHLPGADQYTVWNTDSSGNVVSNAVGGIVSGTSSALELIETSFHQDLNGDGTIGPIPTVIESSGSTSLVQVNSNFYFDNNSSGTGPEFQSGGAVVTAGEFGAWTFIGAEQTAGGYEVALHLPGTDQYTVWNTDSSGNVVSNAVGGIVSGTSSALELIETSFHQDLNGDGTIGPITTVIESFGSTSLTQVGSNFYFDNNSSGTGPEFQSGGAVVTAGEFGAWTFIGAEQTAGGYEVALHLPGTDQYTVWNTDSSGDVVSNAVGGIVSGTSSALELIETSFHQDLNGDGVIDTASTVIEATGSTVLTLSHMTQAATIDAAAKLELTGADSASVTFNGATGSLILDHSSEFSGQVFNFTGDGNPSSSDQFDLKDVAFAAGTTVSYTGTSSGGTLTVSDAQDHTAQIKLAGDYTSSTFSLSSDGSGGTAVIDPVAKHDVADGTLSFGDTASTDQQTVGVTPLNGGAGYIGNFIVDAANAQDQVGWHFNFDSSPPAKTITQSYDVTVTDNHADGTHSSATQAVSVTIAGPGNDAFVFHSGVGSETIVNAGSADTIELDGFSSVTNSHQLAELLSEAQAGQSQSLFTAADGGHDTVINLGDHDSITLTNVHLADLHANNFIIH